MEDIISLSLKVQFMAFLPNDLLLFIYFVFSVPIMLIFFVAKLELYCSLITTFTSLNFNFHEIKIFYFICVPITLIRISKIVVYNAC